MGRVILKAIVMTLRVIWSFLPWMVRMSWFMIRLITVAVISFFAGLPMATSTIANHWLDRAVHGGLYTRWTEQLYHVFVVLAYVMVLLGWIVLAGLTIGLFVLIFRT